MHTTSGLLTYLDLMRERLGPSALAALTVVLAVAVVLIIAVASGLLGPATDPIQVAPVRWIQRA